MVSRDVCIYSNGKKYNWHHTRGWAHIVHMRMRVNYVNRLRGMCTCIPFPFLANSRARRHERLVLLWRLAKSGRRVCPSAKPESLKEVASAYRDHRRERGTPVPALC